MDYFNLLVNAKQPGDEEPVQTTDASKNNKKTQAKKPKIKKSKPRPKKLSFLPEEKKVQSSTPLLDEDLFLKVLKNTNKNNQESSMTYKKRWISSGDITGLCPRKAYFRFMNSPYDLQLYYPYVELITHVGSAVHEWIQKQLLKIYSNAEAEVKFELPDEMLKGFLDLVYETNEGKTVILEIKSSGDEIHEESFQGKTYNWKQLAFYYWVWTQKLKRKCDYVQLAYFKRDFKPVKLSSNKKLQPFKIFTVKDPTKLWDYYKDDILWMLNTIKKSLETKTVPLISQERYQIIKKDECGFCPYQKICSKYPISTQNNDVKFLF